LSQKTRVLVAAHSEDCVDSRSVEGSSGCRNVNNNNVYKGCNLMNLSTY